jgi:phosphonate transport system substrate-binding protein
MNAKHAMSRVSKKKLAGGLIAIFLFALAFTVVFYRFSLDIGREQIITPARSVIDSTSLSKPLVYLGVISRYPPNIIYHGYQPILDYLTSQTPYRFELKLSDDYTQAVQMLVRKEVAAAFLGSYVYINAHTQYGIIPILKPLNENFEPFSRSVVITGISSKIYSMNDLRGKRVALPSKDSFSSIWLLRNELRKHGIREQDLAETRNFPHHQSVIHNVTKNVYDVGVTREYLVKKLINKTVRVLLYSDPVPTSPIVTSADYPKEVIQAIRTTLLGINQNNPRREALTRGWDNEFTYGFVEAVDRDYDVIRSIGK